MPAKDGDLIVLKFIEQRKREELERLIRATPLLQAARLPKYEPDQLDIEGFYQLNRN